MRSEEYAVNRTQELLGNHVKLSRNSTNEKPVECSPSNRIYLNTITSPRAVHAWFLSIAALFENEYTTFQRKKYSSCKYSTARICFNLFSLVF